MIENSRTGMAIVTHAGAAVFLFRTTDFILRCFDVLYCMVVFQKKN